MRTTPINKACQTHQTKCHKLKRPYSAPWDLTGTSGSDSKRLCFVIPNREHLNMDDSSINTDVMEKTSSKVVLQEDDELFFDLDDEVEDNAFEDDGGTTNTSAYPATLVPPADHAASPAHTTKSHRSTDGSNSHLEDTHVYIPPLLGGVIVPPMNFSMINDGVYRSGYPNSKNFGFLLTLKLKTVLLV